jgi:hypothetical protein
VELGRNGNRLVLKVNETSFSAGEAYPGSPASPRPLERFDFRASVTVRVSEERLLHDDLGGGPAEDVNTHTYP